MSHSNVSRGAGIRSTTAESLVRAEPAVVFSAALGLVQHLWSVREDDVVEAVQDVRLVHGVRLDGQIACWLSWELTAAGPTTTKVRLVHDELSTTSVPEPDLEGVLSRLRLAAATARNDE